MIAVQSQSSLVVTSQSLRKLVCSTSLDVIKLAIDDTRLGLVVGAMEVDRDRLVRRGLHRHRHHAWSLAIRHVVAHLLHHQHHLHLLVHLDLALVLGLHGLAYLLGALFVLVPKSNVVEEDDARQTAAEDDDSDDDQGDDYTSDGVANICSLAGPD